MKLSNIRATFGLNATATLGAAGTSGNLSLGQATQAMPLAVATLGYSSQIIFAGSGATTSLNVPLNSHSSTTTWAAGVQQIETATAAGTVSAGGNAAVVVTATGMTGSPKTLAIAVASGDTPTLWAAKVRAGLAADVDVAAMFIVSGTTTAIEIKRNPLASFAAPDGAVNIYAANDTALNIATSTGTATGITTVSTSTNTAAGTATSGVKIYDGDGKDIEGATVSMGYVGAIQAVHEGGSGVTATMGVLNPRETYLRATDDYAAIGIANTQVFTAAGPACLKITVFGG